MSTLLKYAGNKQRLMDQVSPALGDWSGVSRYIEPFAGALGSAFNAGVPSRVEISLSDANREIIDFHRTAAAHPGEVEDAANSLPVGEVGYYEVRSWDRQPGWEASRSDIERAARTIYLNRRGFNGLYRVNRLGQFTSPWNRNPNPPRISVRANVKFIEFLSRVRLEHSDWFPRVEEAGKGDVVYCDPPYVDVRDPERGFGGYLGGFCMDEQRWLRDALVDAWHRGARVVVSNSSCPATEELYRGWETREVAATRRIGSRVGSRGATREILAWLPAP